MNNKIKIMNKMEFLNRDIINLLSKKLTSYNDIIEIIKSFKGTSYENLIINSIEAILTDKYFNVLQPEDVLQFSNLKVVELSIICNITNTKFLNKIVNSRIEQINLIYEAPEINGNINLMENYLNSSDKNSNFDKKLQLIKWHSSVSNQYEFLEILHKFLNRGTKNVNINLQYKSRNDLGLYPIVKITNNKLFYLCNFYPTWNMFREIGTKQLWITRFIYSSIRTYPKNLHYVIPIIYINGDFTIPDSHSLELVEDATCHIWLYIKRNTKVEMYFYRFEQSDATDINFEYAGYQILILRLFAYLIEEGMQLRIKEIDSDIVILATLEKIIQTNLEPSIENLLNTYIANFL